VPESRAIIGMDQYTSDAFASLVGQVFYFHRTADAGDAPMHLELIEVQAQPQHATAGARQAFSLLFALRSGDAMPESLLYLRRDDFEPCAWFVNRVTVSGRDPRTPYYEAVFA
jgi:hypothetical protein